MNVILSVILYFFLYLFIYHLFRFITTPFLKKIGFYKYYTPAFFTMPFFNNTLDIHMGTIWDYIKLKNKNPKAILVLLAEGLLCIINEIESGEISIDKKFRGNTHFLKESTLEKFGFKYRSLNPIELILFSLTYFEDCILHIITSKRFALLPLKNLKIISFTGKDLIDHKEEIQEVVFRLGDHREREFQPKESEVLSKVA